jgi:AcrR family transcriptional regulator
VVANVLQAAAAELAARGYTGFRVEDVAAVAGVNKTTIYRRWPTKADLVEATLRRIAPGFREPPDTGNFEQDLLDLLLREVLWQTQEGAGIIRVLLQEPSEPDLQRVLKQLYAETFRPWLAVIERWKARGELAADCDPFLLVEMVSLPPTMRIHHRAQTVDESMLRASVAIVVAGARSLAKTRKAAHRRRK